MLAIEIPGFFILHLAHAPNKGGVYPLPPFLANPPFFHQKFKVELFKWTGVALHTDLIFNEVWMQLAAVIIHHTNSDQSVNPHCLQLLRTLILPLWPKQQLLLSHGRACPDMFFHFSWNIHQSVWLGLSQQG